MTSALIFSAVLFSADQSSAGPPPPPKELAEKAKKLIAAKPKSEAAMMAQAILSGSQLGPGEGWFKTPSKSKYDWNWLAKLHGVDPKKSIEPSKFKGSSDLFRLLDRDGDGEINAADFDWSERSPWMRQQMIASAVFRIGDRNGDGRLDADEWAKIFARAGGKPISQQGMRDLLFPKPPPEAASHKQYDGPTPEILLKGLFAGEVGSMQEGPAVGDKAPDFTLKTTDGKSSITLSKKIGKRPVVLVFGNFSCGPFRSWGQTLAELAEKHKSRADFLGVYVREAHPTNGWRMESNDRAGISYPQPTDYAGRAAVADRCYATLKPAYPLVVDAIDDLAGNGYSGMPARLYVIDAAGKVAYKSARGPFGFKPAEMEQALLLTVLEQSRNAK